MSPAMNRAAFAWRPRSRPTPAPAQFYLMFVCVAMAAMLPTLKSLLHIWATSSAYHQGALAAPLAFWMIAFSNRMRWPASPRPAVMVGSALLIAALLIWLFGRAAGANLMEAGALVLVLLAGFMLIFGVGATREAALPFGVLAFMVPFGETMSAPLQQMTATVALTGLNAIGIDAVRDGLVLTTVGGSYRIAEACAGLGFVLTATMTGLFVSWLAFQKLERRLLFIAGALTLALVANWVRAIVVIGAATLSDQGAAIADNHAGVGWWIYALVVGILFVAAHVFRESGAVETPCATKARRHAFVAGQSGLTTAFSAAVGAVVIAGLYQAAVVTAPRGSPTLQTGFAPSTPDARSWRSTIIGNDPASPLFAHADETIVVRYVQHTNEVRMIAAYFDHDRPDTEIAGETSMASVRRLTGMPGDWAIRYWLGDRLFSDRTAFSIALGAARIRGRHPPGGILAVKVVSGDPALLDTFLADLDAMTTWRPGLQPSPSG